jgi:hypothetical protein
MPARIRKIRHDEQTRLKIQTGNIITRLQKLIAGQVEMPPHAVTAALGLLRKTIPDLTSVEHSGEVATTYVVGVPPREKTSESWAQRQTIQ